MRHLRGSLNFKSVTQDDFEIKESQIRKLITNNYEKLYFIEMIRKKYGINSRVSAEIKRKIRTHMIINTPSIVKFLSTTIRFENIGGKCSKYGNPIVVKHLHENFIEQNDVSKYIENFARLQKMRE